TDDFAPWSGAKPDVLADGCCRSTKELLRSARVEDHHRRPGCRVFPTAQPPGNERNVEACEEPGRHILSADTRRVGRIVRARVDRDRRATIQSRVSGSGNTPPPRGPPHAVIPRAIK